MTLASNALLWRPLDTGSEREERSVLPQRFLNDAEVMSYGRNNHTEDRTKLHGLEWFEGGGWITVLKS